MSAFWDAVATACGLVALAALLYLLWRIVVRRIDP